MKDIILLHKKILFDQSPILFQYTPDNDWLTHWFPGTGDWKVEDGCFIGEELGNRGGILLSRERFEENVMLSFTMSTVLPATRDLNAVFCANWDYEKGYIGDSYVCGVNGWYANKAGIERTRNSDLYTTTALYQYTPGTEIRMTCGAIDGHSFMVVDDVLITEMIDPQPIQGGHVGFSAYCTKLRIKDIEIRKIKWEELKEFYNPEF